MEVDMAKKKREAAVDDFIKSFKSAPAVFTNVVAPRIVLKALIDEHIVAFYEKHGDRSQYKALVDITAVLNAVNEVHPIQMDEFLKYAKDSIAKTYAYRQDRVLARIGKMIQVTPSQYLPKLETVPAAESFADPVPGKEIPEMQMALGEAALNAFAKKFRHCFDK